MIANDLKGSNPENAMGAKTPVDNSRILGGSQTFSFMGLRFLDKPIRDVASDLLDAAKANLKQHVFFVNAHCVNVAARDADYAGILKGAPYLFADGIGMAIAARLWGLHLRNNVNGSDLFPVLCEQAAAADVPLAFLGASPGIAAQCASNMVDRYPGLRVIWVEHGYLSSAEEARGIEVMNALRPGVLFVAKGVPAQETWIRDNADFIDVPVILGVGALFDFYSGAIRRAPPFMRKLHLEWLYRLLQEPGRLFRRYVIGNPEFIFRAIKQRVSGGNGRISSGNDC
jgi:N-acetylglucosaminyldiphosphoundecaprenol N-acetyl-beta-D-mannosaminyltransferase